MSRREALEGLLRRRILILDGAMGTMIQARGLDEAAFRGLRFRDHPRDLMGCNDLLSLTQPEILEEIHLQFLRAGADIIETNTFNATALSLSGYGLEKEAFGINRAAAEIARRAADAETRRTPDRPRFVAGSIGPTSRSASISPRVDDPGFRAVRFDDLERAYHEAARGLLLGGVDLLLPETCFDTLNLKAALFAIQRAFDDTGIRVPVAASLTVADRSGRTFSGQTLEAAWISVQHAGLFGVGLNCATGGARMRPHLEEIARIAPLWVHCLPNAGLPNETGGYDQTPGEMAAILEEYATDGLLNLAGGCCGTTPDHVRAIAEAMEGLPPRRIPASPALTRLSGLEPLTMRPDSNFILIGERTNITGSRRFARLIRDGRYEEALKVAREQVEGGANILDVNLDEGLTDSPTAMTAFLELAASEPDIARLPVMVDSSRFSVLEAGLKCLQGKGVANSLSLKEGEEEFRRRARLVRRYGAAVVVMAFDEKGQAVTAERKIEVLSRAYGILTGEAGFDPADIIFDPGVLAVGTGIPEHNGHAVAFLEATRELKRRFPLSKVSGGVSNLSFSYRGNDAVREAMHAAFLYHAVRSGMDMGIVDAGRLPAYDEIPGDLRERVEDLLLDRRPDAAGRLAAFAEETKETAAAKRGKEDAWRREPIEKRIEHALVRGIDAHIAEDVGEALRTYPSPLSVIEGPLMAGMNAVGELFAAGKRFLPQMVKSARVMKKAVEVLEPSMEAERRASPAAPRRVRIVLATVRGDAHDIGKNIVGAVLGCNNCDVVDLGVMAGADRILRAAQEEKADLIGLSGLITPSLDEMVRVAAGMERAGLRIPLLIGGATTSRRHTAIRIAPAYRGTTVHVPDASRAVAVVAQILGKDSREAFQKRVREEQEEIRRRHAAAPKKPLLSYAEARRRSLRLDWEAAPLLRPAFLGRRVLREHPLAELVPYVDWSPFFHAWEFRGVHPGILDHPEQKEAAREIFDAARALLDRIVRKRLLTADGVFGFYPAASDGDDIILYADESRKKEAARFHTLRQQQDTRDGRPRLALADFIAPAGSGRADYLGAFAATAGLGLDRLAAALRRERDDYNAVLAATLADRLAEAFAERLHEMAREEWGCGGTERLSAQDLRKERYRGIRVAPGYAVCPDHTEKRTIWSLLDVGETVGIDLTETCAMHPPSSVSGFYFAHPEARYFAVGRIGRDQVEAYAARKRMPVEEAERWLSASLAYDPEAGVAPEASR